jgi:hypothetical protein
MRTKNITNTAQKLSTPCYANDPVRTNGIKPSGAWNLQRITGAPQAPRLGHLLCWGRSAGHVLGIVLGFGFGGWDHGPAGA